MAEADPRTPVDEWERLYQQRALTADVIRDFWKEAVPRLAEPPAGPAAVDLSAYDEPRCQRLLLQPLTQLLLGDGGRAGEAAAPGASTICGKVFNNGDPTYSCRDCEQDPTCVLCADCFKRSEHRHHRYQMCVSLGMGGYCDCGDAEAWKRDPCCAAHQPAAEPRPAAAAPPDQAAKAALLFSAAIQYALSVFTRDASSLKIVPLDLDLGREHYPARNVRYATVLYNFGVTTYDKVAETISSATRCSQEEARAAVAAVRKEGVAILHYNDYNGCDEMLKRLKPDQHRSLRRLEIHVVHAHVVAHQRFALRLVRHLRQLLEDVPPLRAVFSAVMAETMCGSDALPSLLERLMASDPRQWKQMRHECHLLLIQGMLMDIESKKYFAEVFTARYQEQTMDSLPASAQEQGTIQDLSVQMYTVPSIAHHLLAEHNALAVVLGTLVEECSTHTHGGQLVLRDVTVEGDARRRFERLLSCLTDARYLLSVAPEAMTEPLRAGVRRGLDTLLEFLCFCEGMEPVIRAQTAHVLYDPPYELQLTLAISLAPLVNQVLEWCAADRHLIVYAYSAVLRKLHSRLPPDKYFRRDQVTLFGRPVSVSQYSVMTIPVSLELPLSRFFAGLHLLLADHDLRFDSAQFAVLQESVSPLQLLERPLRALVMDAQVRAGQWKRNGRSLEIMCNWYSLSMQVADMRDRDLQAAQVCASLMDCDEFVTTLMFRHGANLYLTADGERTMEENPDSDMREHMENNMADFLLLLIHVFAERFHPGVGVVTKEECLQNETIQFLCVKPMSHSQLAKRLPEADANLLETAVRRVADFAAQEDFRGLRTYQLKPEFYGRYNCMWHHFSRHDRSVSEQRQRKLRKETGEPTCLPPPPLPPFRPALLPARAVFTCETTLRTVGALLDRLADAEASSFSETIFQRTLFLISMALNEEERETPTELHQGFCFSRPAQQMGIVDALQKMVGSPRVSSHADLLAWVMAKLNRLLGRSAAAPETAAAAAEDADSEQKRRRAAAAARRARILGQMQAQQKKFIKQNVTALAEHEEERPTAGGGLARAMGGSSMDLSECAGPDEWPVCLGPRQTARPAAAAEYTCILCQASEQVSSTRPAMVMAAFVQLSTVLSRDRASVGRPQPLLFVPSSLHRLAHASSCGHAMHATCWRAHFDSVARERRIHPRVHHLSGFDVQKQEFLCPLCQRLSNTVVPLVPDCVRRRDGDERPGVDNLAVWLNGLLLAASPTLVVDEAASSTSEPPSGDRSSPLLKAVTRQMSHREAGQFTSVIHLGETPPKTHKSTRDMAEKFCRSTFVATHGTPPSAEDRRLPLAVLHACAYTLHATEQLLRHAGRPLLAELGSRAHSCLTQLTHVCATLAPTAAGPAAARDNCRALLRLLLWPAADGPSVLELDAFGLVVTLCHGLPALFAAPGDQPLAPSGSLQDLQCVRLALVLHLVQILLTMDVAELTRQEPMETDGEPADRDEQQWLAELYTLVRSAAGVDVADISSLLLRQYVSNAVTPFLRCCALYFHFLTGVRAPAELQQPLPLAEQYPHLLRYLGLDSLSVPQATDCHSPLNELAFRWCRQGQLQASVKQVPARFVVSSRVSKLIDLPHEYSDLIIQASSFRCECGESEAAPSPALCLVCGAMLCSDQTYTRDRLQARRGMDGHALSCGAGVGLLLLVRRCRLYLIHSADVGPRKALYPPPYVDRFGEVDQGLRRGNPLTLQTEQYDKLNRLWLSHGVSDEVTRYVEEYSSGMILD